MRMNVRFESAALDRRLAALKRGVWESTAGRRCLEEIKRIVREGNRTAALAGIDRYGQPYDELKSVRKGKYRGATGPPLAPFREGSRIISNFRVSYTGTSPEYRIVGQWGGFPELRYHIVGNAHLPIRKPNGIRMVDHYKIRDAIRAMLPHAGDG